MQNIKLPVYEPTMYVNQTQKSPRGSLGHVAMSPT